MISDAGAGRIGTHVMDAMQGLVRTDTEADYAQRHRSADGLVRGYRRRELADPSFAYLTPWCEAGKLLPEQHPPAGDRLGLPAAPREVRRAPRLRRGAADGTVRTAIVKTDEAPKVIRTRHARPFPDERCPCGKRPSCVQVDVLEDGAEVRTPVCRWSS